MNKSKLEALIEARGKDFFATISGEKHLPSSLYSQATPADFNSFIKVFSESFAPILCKFKEIGAPDYLPAPAVSGLCVLRHDHG